MKLNILCLYYDIMNLYGEAGNIKVLEYHLKELGIDYNIDKLSNFDIINFKKYDLVIIGEGSEESRDICLSHLLKYRNDIKKAIDKGVFFLVTGNTLGMFGKSLYGKDALNIFDFDVTRSKERISQEIILNNDFGDDIYGFLNHEDIFKVPSNTLFESEGIKYNNFFGTMVLGPILARNPDFLNYFLKNLILHKNKDFEFNEINLKLNKIAYNEFIEFKKTKKFNSNWS